MRSQFLLFKIRRVKKSDKFSKHQIGIIAVFHIDYSLREIRIPIAFWKLRDRPYPMDYWNHLLHKSSEERLYILSNKKLYHNRKLLY